jgi:beta-N-acetylhexosaminidase
MHKLNILSLRSLLIALFLFITFFVYSFLPTGTPPDDTDGDRYSTYWVDSVFASLDLEQRIAQLIILEVHSDRGEAYENEITRMIKQHNIGGVIFFNGTPSSQVKLTNRLQSQVQTPLFVTMDAEWGPSMRIDSTIIFPRQMALGAIQNNKLIYDMGFEIGRQLKRLGVHINFAPVVDVNNNANNPVINFRSFGESPVHVAEKGIAYMRGLQDAGIIACAKHFPGHGDTAEDSHHTLPFLQQPRHELDSIHIYPFKRLIAEGLKSVMTAHLEIPELEPTTGKPSSLSEHIVNGLLKKELGFQGLVITDGLQMRGVSDYAEPGALELQALMAGNDMLMFPKSISAVINSVRNAIEEGILDEEIIDEKCKKVLFYKQQAGLDTFEYISADNLTNDLNTAEGILINNALSGAAITLVSNPKNRIPIRNLQHQRIAALAIGDYPGNSFHRMLGKYAPVSNYGIDKNHSPEGAKRMADQLKDYDTVIISIHNTSFFPSRNYGINGKTVTLVNELSEHHNVILTTFATPYSLAFFDEVMLNKNAVLVAYQDDLSFREAAAQAIFGGGQTTGRLPVSAGASFDAGRSIITPDPIRIRFGMPENTGILAKHLAMVDSIAINGIRMEAYPGCQIAIIKDGVMIYDKAFGFHTYDSIRPVKNSDIYDLASITKIAATTAAVMHLVDQDIIELDQAVGRYLTFLKNSDKGNIRLRHLLAHQARLFPWIPFHTFTMNNGKYLDGYYSNRPSGNYPVKVAENLFLNAGYRDTIFTQISISEMLENTEYSYSDLGFILLAELIETMTGQGIDSYVEQVFYRPLGLSTMGYNPLKRFEADRIIPSENDIAWRRQIVRGHVHDQTAAMLGGVSGHAGLFSNAADLAVLMHMLLNDGSYGGKQFLNPETVEEFSRVQFFFNNNRRGLGFDKPQILRNEPGPACLSASPLSFGHSGFTGTLAWADPVENLIFVFLSNRTFPDMNNRIIIEENIRTTIQQAVYDAIYLSRITSNNE